MKLNFFIQSLGFFMATLTVGCATTQHDDRLIWAQLPPLPDPLGVAAPFVGTSDGALLVAGGANFPNGYPWEGGKKVWHDRVYALTATNAHWQMAGRLPRPLAYGISITTPKGVLCIGGSDATGHHAEVFMLKYSGGKIQLEDFPALPVPLADAAGALAGSTVYVCGGAERAGEQAALNRLFALDLAASPAGWRELSPCPGKPRILPVAAAIRDTFYLVGGAALEPANGRVARVYLRDAWSYTPGSGWQALPDSPKPIVAAPSPAPSVDSEFLVVGGDDGSHVGFKPVQKHPGFSKSILAYDARANAWSVDGETPAPRATTPVVRWQNRFVIPCGEMRPGIRSPQIWTLSLEMDHSSHD
jgi:N-acetylneuraminic acid mutarotase